MYEEFLYFIWKSQKFQSENLLTTDDQPISIYSPGINNQDSGPDFSNARIRIGTIEWSGDVEIHITSSDWNRHNHSQDPAYNRVILHVVWHYDEEVYRNDGTVIPTLSLEQLVDASLPVEYDNYLKQKKEIFCENVLDEIDEFTWNSNLDVMLTRRLEQKSQRILKIAEMHHFDWETAAYITLARNFGFSTNSEAFERLAFLTPLRIVSKHTDHPVQIEALLFGQAGLLESPVDEYHAELCNEFLFLKKKYNLEGIEKILWKTGKIRPGNFPSVRIAQFSSLLTSYQKLFSLFVSITSVRELKRAFQLNMTDYWKKHYNFSKKVSRGTNQLGSVSLDNITINSVAPILAAYSLHTGEADKMERAVNLLQQVSPESNRYTRKFESIGKAPTSAFDSQAQITLFQDFCSQKKCLTCGVGVAIFNR